MTLHFYLKYSTVFGQRVYIVSENLNEDSSAAPQRVAMEYVDEEYWKAVISLPGGDTRTIYYYYVVVNEDGTQIFDGEEHRFIDLSGKRQDNITILDTWTDAGNINNVYFTKAFEKTVPPIKGSTSPLPKIYSHEFRVKAPLLREGETLCMVGSTPHLKSWNTADPILLTPQHQWFVARLDLDQNEWPAFYKYGIYNLHTKSFVQFEDGENRVLRGWQVGHGRVLMHEGFAHLPEVLWRGTGINLPVFSLRSKKSFGVGEFSDIKLLVDWCKEAGVKMIQLLPVNDTSAQNNWHDSYPYAAISAFALHPLYINLEKVAGKKHAALVRQLSKKQKQLNALDAVDYEQVMKFKLSLLEELYELQKDEIKDDVAYLEFFELNRHWLVPYAAFCFLKDKYKTADFTQWKKYAAYDESEIQKLANPNRNRYHRIAIHYYIQYHLHKELQEVVRYAHRNHIVVKGDLPIGIYRYSADAWVAPSLYNMEAQAGAPPDDFSAEGQNWGFPTYNWEVMKRNEFEWWRRRFDQLGKYFDVFRIDHILGFFRIWSIPMDSVEGTMGMFVPAIPVDVSEFGANNIYFNYTRYCKPFIDEETISEIFGDRAEEAISQFLERGEDGNFSLKEEVDTQRKALSYVQAHRMDAFQKGLFDLISNVILFEDPNSGGTRFHFRIGMNTTSSFRRLDPHTQRQLQWLYDNYFFERQDHFWRKTAMEKLPHLKRTTNMLVCGEDLGMVPPVVPAVMQELGILSLNVQRMPKGLGAEFFNTEQASYLSIVQPSTHDMSAIREWWTEDRNRTQRFYNTILRREGEAPLDCTPDIAKQIMMQHLESPAMWAVFLLQDLMAMEPHLRVENPKDERINNPANAKHYWRYRMKGNLNDLIKDGRFNTTLRNLIAQSGRLHQSNET